MRLAVRYDTPDEKGQTRRDRNIVFGHSELNPEIKIGEGLPTQLWQWFWELSAARGQGFSGPLPIGYAEIAAWAALTGSVIQSGEVGILRKMDTAFLSAMAIEQAEAAERAKIRKE